MSYEVIARKYRPQTFEDVVGQGHVTSTLANAIGSERVAHAYLFVGPRGTGKTTTARIFAKALNCEKGPTATPCNQCELCQEIMAGRSLDVMEIDGASNNKVDDVHQIRDGVRFLPTRARFKIYIIDEVHMLSISAFNALLKTLEEPPPHAKFIFATTEPMKVPNTILSRCQRFDMRRISTRDIIGRLRYIADEESVTIDDDALLAIARGAEGGMRDAQSAFDQLISFKGKELNEDDVLTVFGLVSHSLVQELARATLASDIPQIIRTISECEQAGKDLHRMLVDLLEHFRNVLIFAHSQKTEYLDGLAESQISGIQEQAAMADPGRISRIVDILIESEGRIRQSLSRKIMLEMALLRAARAAATVSIEELLTEVARLKSQTGSGDEKKK